jgi:hypothetical protein
MYFAVLYAATPSNEPVKARLALLISPLRGSAGVISLLVGSA